MSSGSTILLFKIEKQNQWIAFATYKWFINNLRENSVNFNGKFCLASWNQYSRKDCDVTKLGNENVFSVICVKIWIISRFRHSANPLTHFEVKTSVGSIKRFVCRWFIVYKPKSAFYKLITLNAKSSCEWLWPLFTQFLLFRLFK